MEQGYVKGNGGFERTGFYASAFEISSRERIDKRYPDPLGDEHAGRCKKLALDLGLPNHTIRFECRLQSKMSHVI